MEFFKINAILYSRNNSTRKPTLYHIINKKNNSSFCGFEDFCAEVFLSTDEDEYLKTDFCKKCIKANNKIQNKLAS